MKKLSVVLVALFVLGLVLPASAQGTSATISITEADLNAAYRVTNPSRTQVTNVYVDVQEGQVVITGDVRIQRGSNPTVSVAVTYVPKLVQSGSRTRLDWDISSIIVDGENYTGTAYGTVRNAYTTALRNAVNTKVARTFNVTNVTVGGDVISVTGSR